MSPHTFHHLLKNKYALSTVVTTLIILVISVLLASVVTYFAINVVSTRVQEESLSLSSAHIWLNPGASAGTATYSQASLKVINTGGRDVVVTKLSVRGQDNAWTSWAANNDDSQFIVYSTTNQPIQTDMYFQPDMAIPATNPATTAVNPQTLTLTGNDGDQTFDFKYATSDLVLKSGFTMLIYIVNPDSITINDIGLTVSITLHTAQAMYYQECNVQAYAPITEAAAEEPVAAQVAFTKVAAFYDAADADGSQGALIIKNNEAQAISITGLSLNTVAGTGLYYAVAVLANPADLSYITPANLGTTKVDLQDLVAKQADPISVAAGSSAIIYYTTTLAEANVGNNLGLSVTITGFTAATTQVPVSAKP